MSEYKDEIISTKIASIINGTGVEAISAAIRLGRLKAKKKNNTWKILKKDLLEYKRNKYSREKSKINNQLVFDNSKGLYSVKQVANIFGVNPQKIYHLIRRIPLKTIRAGGAIIINEKEIEKIKNFGGFEIEQKK